MQFSFLPVGVKWKVVKNVHCPLLLINTGLMSRGALTKKLLKNEENMHFPHGPLLKAPQRASLMHAWCKLRQLVRASAYYIERKLWKRRLWNMISFALLAVTLFRFFLGPSQFGVIAVYPWMCQQYQKLNQPSLCSVCLTHVHTLAALIRYFKLNTGCQDGPLCKNGNARVNVWHLYTRLWL